MDQQSLPALLPAVRIDSVSDDTLAAQPEFFAARQPAAERVWPVQDDRREVRLGVLVDLAERIELARLFFVIPLVMVAVDTLAAQPVVSGLWPHLLIVVALSSAFSGWLARGSRS